MEGRRRLWTGPHGPSLGHRLIAESPRGAEGLWIAPTPPARDRLARDLARVARGPSPATIWTWEDLWDAVRGRRGEGPVRASAAALRAALNESVARAGREGSLRSLGASSDTPGFRARLARKVASWTRQGRDERSSPPEDAVASAEWSIFVAYRRLLARWGWEDGDGFALWAARTLRDAIPEGLLPHPEVCLLGPFGSRTIEIAVEALHRSAGSMTVLLTCAPGGGSDRERERFLAWGFEERAIPISSGMPAGPARIVARLFADDDRDASQEIDGLEVRGAPEGEGQALIVARRVRDLLEGGSPPDEILVVVPRPGESCAVVVETLRAWDIPVAHAECGRYATESAVAALRGAMLLPVEGWESDRVVSLLRNGRVRPPWPEAAPALALASAATAIRESRAHRDPSAIRSALRKAATTREGDDSRTRLGRLIRSRASAALPVFDRLVAAVADAARPGAWDVLVRRLDRLAEALGIAPDPALDALRGALEDQGELLDRLGRGADVWSWAAFADEVDAAIRDLALESPPVVPDGVRVVGPGDAEGAAFRHVILADLAEGTYPSRSALDAAKSDDPAGLEELFGREKARFLGLCGAASESLTLAYPTVDERGYPLLAAGFLGDVARLFSPEAWSRAGRLLDRVDAVLPEDLAFAPIEARVHAVAGSCLRGDASPLDALAREARHRGPLAGTARALRLAHWRSRSRRFGRYDGRLDDPRIADRLAAMFGSHDRPFSTSQLESLALCPFQFFQRYVLALDPPEDRLEMQEDPARRGSLLHRALEALHTRLRDLPAEDGTSPIDRVAVGIGPALEEILRGEREPDSEIDRGLAAIEAARILRLGRRYASQYRRYVEKQGRAASGRYFEVAFGRPGDAYPALEIGDPPHGIAVSGVIDRIDFVESEGRPLFRVIDYKSGSGADPRDIDAGIALQLPLYAIAAERMIFGVERAAPLDAAYWAIRGKGFKPARAMTAEGDRAADVEAEWLRFSASLRGYLLALVERLRAGDLPLKPRKADCQGHCDYQFVCRITQARRAAKAWPESPNLEVRS